MLSIKQKYLIHKISFIAVIILFIGLSTSYSLFTPTFEGPDENTHYFLSTKIFSQEYTQLQYLTSGPLAYYINAVILTFLEPPQNIEIHENWESFPENKNRFIHGMEEVFPYSGTAHVVHVLRIFNIFVGATTLIFVFKISKLIFQNKNFLAIFTTAIIALTPKFTSMNSVLNTDPLVYLFGTISIFFLIKFVNNKEIKFSILLGLFVGLAILSKAGALILYLVVITIFLYLIFSKQVTKVSALKNYVVFLGISIASGGWYVIHKVLLTFNPDNLHFGTAFQMLTDARDPEPYRKVPFDEILSRITDIDLLHFRMVDMIWSNLGWHVIKSPTYLMNLGEFFLVVSFAGLFLVFVKKTPFSDIKLNKNHLIILFTTSIFMLVSMVLYLSIGGAGDIRYTFPVIVSFGILFTIGYYIFFDSKKLRYLLLIPIILLISMNFELITEMDKSFDHGVYNILPSAIRYYASSEYNDWTNAQKAFDSNLKTLWHSEGGLPQTLTIDYRKPVINDHLVIVAGNMWHPQDFEVQGSNDGKNIVTLETISTNLKWSTNSIHEYSLSNDQPYQYYTVKFNSVQGPNQFVEISELSFSLKD